MRRIKFSNCRIVEEAICKNGLCDVTLEIEDEDDTFIFVEASKLSMSDAFMRYNPKSTNQAQLKEKLEKLIKVGVISDFYRPKYDPSLAEDGTICYLPGKMPAVGFSYKWWKEAAQKFKPERRSRLGTMNEYIAFLGVLMKTLVANGWTVEAAWYAVCNDSKQLGHYADSKDSKITFELTGSREVCGFYDLSNTSKILLEQEEIAGFWLAGGEYCWYGKLAPLAELDWEARESEERRNSVGWIILK